MEFTQGIFENIPFEEYHKVSCVHKSMFKSIIRSGRQLKHYLDTGDQRSKQMDFGNLVDTLLFEPEFHSSESGSLAFWIPYIISIR